MVTWMHVVWLWFFAILRLWTSILLGIELDVIIIFRSMKTPLFWRIWFLYSVTPLFWRFWLLYSVTPLFWRIRSLVIEWDRGTITAQDLGQRTDKTLKTWRIPEPPSVSEVANKDSWWYHDVAEFFITLEWLLKHDSQNLD